MVSRFSIYSKLGLGAAALACFLPCASAQMFNESLLNGLPYRKLGPSRRLLDGRGRGLGNSSEGTP